MDPEQIRRALELVRQAREAGHSDREINSALRRSGLAVNSIRELETEAGYQARNAPPQPSAPAVPSDAGVPNPRRPAVPQTEPAPTAERLRNLVTNAADMFFLGMGTDAVGLASPAAKDALDAQAAAARRDNPITAGATGLAASLAPGSLIARGTGVLGRGLQGIGAGEGILPRAVTGAAHVGATGAAEGGLYGFGLTEGGAKERLQGAKRGAAIGGGVGAATGAALGATAGAQQIARAPEASGRRLVQVGSDVSGLRPRTSLLRGEIQSVKRQAQGLIRPLESGQEALPQSVYQEFVNSPLMRKQLAKIGTPEARAAAEELDKIAAGKGGDPSGLTFKMADDVRNQLKFKADEIRARRPDQPGPAPSSVRAEAYQGEFNLLDRALRESPSFDRSRGLFAQEGTMRRAVDAGEKAFKSKADDFVSEFQNLPGGAPAQRAYRQGAFGELVADLNQGSGSVEGFLKKALSEGSETQQKLRVILGDDGFDVFRQAVREEKTALTKAKVILLLGKAGGFLVGGTSIFGGIAGLGLGG